MSKIMYIIRSAKINDLPLFLAFFVMLFTFRFCHVLFFIYSGIFYKSDAIGNTKILSFCFVFFCKNFFKSVKII